MIINLGSINADFAYEVPHLPQPGETVKAELVRRGLGGKGVNMSVAAVRAGAPVRHIGAVGVEGGWAKDALARYGVDVSHVATVAEPTGHAIINVDPDGQNAIVILPGANRAQSEEMIKLALSDANPADILLLQNETDGQAYALNTAREKGLTSIYASAPFDEIAVRHALEGTDILVLNEIELQQLEQSFGKRSDQLGVSTVVVTRGSKGVRFRSREMDWAAQDVEAPQVTAVDTTGAGDTFTGVLAAELHSGLSLERAVTAACMAAALMVTRKGTADVIPTADEVRAFANRLS